MRVLRITQTWGLTPEALVDEARHASPRVARRSCRVSSQQYVGPMGDFALRWHPRHPHAPQDTLAHSSGA